VRKNRNKKGSNIERQRTNTRESQRNSYGKSKYTTCPHSNHITGNQEASKARKLTNDKTIPRNYLDYKKCD
jgi:hypothetical protein